MSAGTDKQATLMKSGVPGNIRVTIATNERIVWEATDATYIDIELVGVETIAIEPTIFGKNFKYIVWINGTKFLPNSMIASKPMPIVVPPEYSNIIRLEIVFQFGDEKPHHWLLKKLLENN